jgi:hypothetical protein
MSLDAVRAYALAHSSVVAEIAGADNGTSSFFGICANGYISGHRIRDHLLPW